ncbi:MAG: tetratricopeptide repeat protein, partial [Hydrogenobaculum sp.]
MKRNNVFYIAFVLLFYALSMYSCAQNTHNIEELSNKNSEYYYNIGMASLTAGNYAAAIANFKKAILKDQYNYKAYDKLALAYANVGNYKKAIKNIDKALSIKPDYYQAILDKAIILQAEHKTKEAIDTLNRCITNDYCSLRPQAYYQLANIYKSKKDIKDYIKNLN